MENEFGKFFNINKCKQLYNSYATIVQNGEPTHIRDDVIVKKYIDHFLIPITTGEIFEREDNTFKLKDETTIKKAYFNRLPKELKKWFFNENTKVRRVISSITEPRVVDEYFNTFEGFKHKKKPYESYSPEIKAKVEKMNNYIREVLASGKQDIFDYLIKWYACVAQGKKNDSLLYFKAPEGVGKSRYSDFMRYHVLGTSITLKCPNANTLTTRFNSMLNGKIYVCYEELPVFSTAEWEAVAGKLKDMVTSDKTVYESKGKDPFETNNINNFVVLTNVEALKHSEGRRIFILDVSTARAGDHKYFDDLTFECFNDEVGEAYYNYLLSIDTSNFRCQRDMPDTQNKTDIKASNICPEYQFLKKEFILKEKNIKHSLTELYNMYVDYVKVLDKIPRICTNVKFRQRLNEIGMISHKSNDQRIFRYSHQELKAIFDKKGWIHELDYEEHQENKMKRIKSPTFIDEVVPNEQVELLIEKIKFLEEKVKTLQKDPTEYETKNRVIVLQEKNADLKRKIKILREEKKALNEYIDYQREEQIEILSRILRDGKKTLSLFSGFVETTKQQEPVEQQEQQEPEEEQQEPEEKETTKEQEQQEQQEPEDKEITKQQEPVEEQSRKEARKKFIKLTKTKNKTNVPDSCAVVIDSDTEYENRYKVSKHKATEFKKLKKDMTVDEHCEDILSYFD